MQLCTTVSLGSDALSKHYIDACIKLGMCIVHITCMLETNIPSQATGLGWLRHYNQLNYLLIYTLMYIHIHTYIPRGYSRTWKTCSGLSIVTLLFLPLSYQTFQSHSQNCVMKMPQQCHIQIFCKGVMKCTIVTSLQ